MPRSLRCIFSRGEVWGGNSENEKSCIVNGNDGELCD